jgi:ElaB/YqjD/DUF883 family membrane-anchored ribosome-binding protein
MATAGKTDHEATIKDLQDQIADLKKDFVGVADILKQLASGELNAASDAVRNRADRFAGKARAAADSAMSQVEEATAATRQTISKNPLTAAAIAAAVGFVIGILARR